MKSDVKSIRCVRDETEGCPKLPLPFLEVIWPSRCRRCMASRDSRSAYAEFLRNILFRYETVASGTHGVDFCAQGLVKSCSLEYWGRYASSDSPAQKYLEFVL